MPAWTVMRELIWKKDEGFEGWGCCNCEFVLPNPQSLVHMNTYVEESLVAFFSHDCESKKLPREV
jgi:hypothetical protein